jgi:probable addiction module antidote protein
MNKEAILKHTTSYKEDVLERLHDQEFAKIYLETAFESYQEDKDTEALLLAMRDVAEAQGGIGKLAKRTAISREHLYDVLASKHNPRLDNWLDILSALGFRVRLEQQKAPAEHALAHKS